MGKSNRQRRVKSATEISYLALKKRYSSLIALQRKLLKNKNISAAEKKEIESNITALMKKREDVIKQISTLSKIILEKQIAQLTNLDTSKLTLLTKSESQKAVTNENLFNDNIDEFLTTLNKL